MQNGTTLEAVLRRDRAVVLGSLIGVSALAWAYTIYLAGDMGQMEMATVPCPRCRLGGAWIFSCCS